MKLLTTSPLLKLGFALLVLAAIILSVAPRPLHACRPPSCCVECGSVSRVDYYSDPGKTQYLSTCLHDCDGVTTCNGPTSSYFTIVYAHCCQC